MFELNSFVKITFFIDYTLIFFFIFYMLKAKNLLNINYIDYLFINQNLAQIIYNQLKINFIFLFKSRNIKKFNNNVFFYFITYILYFIFTIQNYIKLIIFMLIINFDQHQIILNKF